MDLTLRRRSARRGFTLIETVSSAGLLTLLVFAAMGASQVAMRSTTSVVTLDAAESRDANALTRLRRLLMPASLSLLEAVPAIQGGVLEPMQDGVVYDNLSFRMVTGFQNGGPVYQPPLGQSSWRIWFQADPQGGAGALVLDDGRSTTTLLEDVRLATFTLTGRNLSINLQTLRPDGASDASSELRLALLVP